jgi:hypothetical protein
MFAASKTDSVSGAGPDAQFNQVTMLLHGDGTNGAQNNTFVDNSTNNFTVTRFGNTTQGSFSPYGSNWSAYFNGTTDALTAVYNNDFDISTPTSFTVEAWIYRDGTGDADWRVVGGSATSSGFFGGRGTLSVGLGRSGIQWDLESDSNVYSLNTWTHIAYVRNSSNVLSIFVNGVRVATTTTSVNFGLNGGSLEIASERQGQLFGGYISNVRVVRGGPIYDPTASTITIPTAPFPSTEGFLTCQSNRFIDNASGNFPIIVTGTPKIQRFSPFGTSAAYSTSVIGGSGYFDGSGDYLTVPDDVSLNLSADFTVEAWVNVNSASGEYCVFHNHTANTNGVALTVNSGAPRILSGNGSWSVLLNSSITIKPNTWNHIAGTRSGNTYTIWVNGVSGGTASSATTPSYSGGAQIGRLTAGVPIAFLGYMSNLRVVKGTAVYTTTFTPSTTPLTAISGTSLLLYYTNGAIFDNAMMNDLETVGNTQISTSVKKFGTGSIAFDGTGDYLSIATNTALQFGTGNFTFECWVYRNSASGQIFIADFGVSSANGWALYDEGSGGNMQVRIADVDRIAVSPIPATTWTHLAVVRVGTTITLYVNGTAAGSYASAGTNLIYAGTNYIGSYIGSSSYMNGYMDDIRITKGYARYTTTFTPPTSALSDTGPY